MGGRKPAERNRERRTRHDARKKGADNERQPHRPASPDNLKVAYHPGGLLFAGDERYFPAGWYLFDGEDACPVTVFEPISNDQIVVGE